MFLQGRTKQRISMQRLGTMLVSALLTFTVLSTPAWAQNDDDAGSQVTLNLQDVDIRVLINTVAEVSGKNFIVDPRVKGKVSVISGAALDPDQLYDVFLSILEVHNYATVESGSIIKVLPNTQIKQRPTPFGPTEDANDAQITQIVQLDHASVQELVAIVRPLIPPTSHFAPHVPSNSLILTDTAANIQRVLEIIKRIDVPDKRSNVHVVYLDKTKASELAATLTQIIATQGGRPQEGGGAAGAKSVTIQALDSIGALVINATDDDFAKIQALIDELDIERQLASDISVIALKHAKAEDLVSVLTDLTRSQGAEGVAGEATIQADEATNSLIVKATGSQLQSVIGVIEKLDLRRPQVFVETVIAEVSLDQAAELGVTWGAGGPQGETASTTSTDADGNTVTTPGVAGLGNLVNRDNRNQIIGTASAGTDFELSTGGFTYELLDYRKYQLDVVINALRSDTNSNILSTPNILTLDNEEAEIVVGQEVPFVTGRFNNGFGNQTSVNGDGQTTGGTFGNSFQSIERKDVGIKLKIKPQINDGDSIQLEVTQEISSVANTAVAGQADLITNRRSIDTTIQVDDGQVIVLGGLIQDDVIDTVNRVPILGQIPILGVLFRSKSKTAVKRNLMVFLKPRIVRTAEDSAKYTKAKYDEVRRDGKISRDNSSDFLIHDADPPVLDEYENTLDDGVLGSERRKDNLEQSKNGKRRSGLSRLIFGDSPTDESYDDDESFDTRGDLEKLDSESAPIEWEQPIKVVPADPSSPQGGAIQVPPADAQTPAAELVEPPAEGGSD